MSKTLFVSSAKAKRTELRSWLSDGGAVIRWDIHEKSGTFIILLRKCTTPPARHTQTHTHIQSANHIRWKKQLKVRTWSESSVLRWFAVFFVFISGFSFSQITFSVCTVFVRVYSRDSHSSALLGLALCVRGCYWAECAVKRNVYIVLWSEFKFSISLKLFLSRFPLFLTRMASLVYFFAYKTQTHLAGIITRHCHMHHEFLCSVCYFFDYTNENGKKVGRYDEK